jgi:hypothetical protein
MRSAVIMLASPQSTCSKQGKPPQQECIPHHAENVQATQLRFATIHEYTENVLTWMLLLTWRL